MNGGLMDCYISGGQLIFGGPERGGFVSKGFELEVPSLTGASQTILNEVEIQTRTLLRSVDPGTRLQFRWDTGPGGYRSRLLDYYDATEALAHERWSRRQRHERFSRYMVRVESGDLRRERLHVFATRPVRVEGRRRGVGRAGMEALLEASAGSCDLFEQDLQQMAQRLGGSARALDDEALFEENLRFYSPALADRQERRGRFDPSRSVLENCLYGDGAPVTDPESGFHLDGQFFGFCVMSALPQATTAGMMLELTGLPIRDVGIVVNVVPLDAAEEVSSAEAAADKLRRALRHSASGRMRNALQFLEERISRILSNEIVPFSMQFVARAWDESK